MIAHFPSLLPDFDDSVPRARDDETLRGLADIHVGYDVVMSRGRCVGAPGRHLLLVGGFRTSIHFVYHFCALQQARSEIEFKLKCYVCRIKTWLSRLCVILAREEMDSQGLYRAEGEVKKPVNPSISRAKNTHKH